MDPLTGAAVVGVGYYLLKREDAKLPEDTQVGMKPLPVVPAAVAPIIPKVLNQNSGLDFGNLSGAVIGGLIGGQLGDWTNQSLSQYNAPSTKMFTVPVFTAVGAIAGGIIGGIVLKVGIIAAASAGVIVLVILVAVYAVFALASIIEDGVRANEWRRHMRHMVFLVEAKKFKEAILYANLNAQNNQAQGLGFSLGPNQILWMKGTLATQPVLGWAGGQYGLERDVFWPAIKEGDIDGIFGVDASIMTMNNGAALDCKAIWKDAIKPMQSTHASFVVTNKRNPTSAEWQGLLDSEHDNEGHTLRDYSDAADGFVNRIASGIPWVPRYYMEKAWRVPLSLTASEQAIQDAAEAAAIAKQTQPIVTTGGTTLTSGQSTGTGQGGKLDKEKDW
jgi:hypothetical protein